MKKSYSLLLLLLSTFIFGQNTSPVANNQTVSTDKYSPVAISLTASDAENDILTYFIKSLPSNGTLKNGNTIVSSSDLPLVLSSNNIIYTPTGNYSGTDSFTFVARDLSLATFAKANGLKFISNNGKPVTYNKPAGKTYFLIEENIGSSSSKIDWDEAKKLTDALKGAEMYIILNAEMELLVWNGLKSMGLTGPFWLGLYQDHDNPEYAEPGNKDQNWGGWTWTDGVTLKDRGYQNWYNYPTEPNDWPSMFSNDGEEDYGQFDFSGNRIQWNDMKLGPGSAKSWPLFEFSIQDNGSESNLATVTINVSTTGFNLQDDNNKIQVSSSTCNGKNDGAINLSIEDTRFDYTITVSGQSSPVLITGNNKTASVTGLAKGTYTVCFKVDGQLNYEQCFEAVIDEPSGI
jgi:hypothetical protein|tara:strand:+ start:695 stop:1903 length:1209 start_codon:yes stop_codon:yes gene_type:complete